MRIGPLSSKETVLELSRKVNVFTWISLSNRAVNGDCEESLNELWSRYHNSDVLKMDSVPDMVLHILHVLSLSVLS